MTATDELRRMLDERGVEWHGDIATYWRSADAVESLFADNALDVSLYAVSPERAIAATLGRGMLTADDVRDLIEQHSDASGGNGRDFHNGAYAAIADELNATLWRGTCHDVGKGWMWRCSECRCRLYIDRDYLPNMWVDGMASVPRYCPNCGRRVVAGEEA